MSAKTVEGIELDLCKNCGGIWFDQGELEKVIEAERAYHGITELQNWRAYDRGREGYDPEPAPAPTKGFLQTLLGE
jgi:Zn-finger nucleic acid-binding protein